MFNLEDYEDVATLNRWFIENYPMGRSNLVTEFHDPVNGYIRVRAEIYRDSSDAYPAVSNVAFGARDLYNRNMARYYCEDTATSALGRAIILLKGSNKTATRESMEQVAEADKVKADIAKVKAKMADTSKEYVPVEKASDPWEISSAAPVTTMEQAVEMVKDVLGGTPIDESCTHGARVWKTGTTKAGKPWGHWKCNVSWQNTQETQCDPIWYEISADGTWKPQVKK